MEILILYTTIYYTHNKFNYNNNNYYYYYNNYYCYYYYQYYYCMLFNCSNSEGRNYLIIIFQAENSTNFSFLFTKM